jgi:catechol-2,3-dioxygenase
MRARLDAHGLAYTVSDVPLRQQRQLFFEDPAGNGVELNFS